MIRSVVDVLCLCGFQILEKVGAVYSSVMTESTVESKEFLSHFSELLRFLVRLHRRPADSYEPILKLIGVSSFLG